MNWIDLMDQVESLRENQQAAASILVSLLGTYISVASRYPSTKLDGHRLVKDPWKILDPVDCQRSR